MKNLLAILLFSSFTTTVCGQLHLPELSPEGRIYQKVGYVAFDIRYGRPAARERKIMGDLVPYKKLWRTGAGKCSTISFDQDVFINKIKVPAGIYALLTIPDEKEWTVLLNTDTNKVYGDPVEYDVKNEALRIKVLPERINRFHESLTFTLDVIQYDAMFYLAWENTQIQFPIATRSHEKAVAEINSSLEKNPNDQEMLSAASFYYYMNNESAEQILTWLNKALSLGEERWIFHQKVDVLERMKNYTEARNTAREAIAFLSRTKPVEWESSVKGYEERVKKWPAR